jgi:membrane-bound serine protease (ClpP class)
MKNAKFLCLLIALATALTVGGPPAGAGTPLIYTLPATGSINPGLAGFIAEGIEQAEKDKAGALVILLDTPGGLEASMRKIGQSIINAKVPVIVYVSPKGARAASAGVFITMAAHVAAMAPGTNIGAAHPVGIGVGGKMDKVMAEKVVNDMVAYGRAMAKERGRNADWVEKAVKKSVSIDAEEALKLKVIDLIAEDLNELLAKTNGLPVKVAGKTQLLKTTGAPVREIREGVATTILKHIADPNIAFILMMIGLAGLYFELAHPGVVLPGVVGAMSLLLALFAFQTLPVNYTGLLLILLSFIFFILEVYVVSYGLLSVGGVISLLLGSMMLFRGGGPGMEIAWGVLIPAVLAVSVFFIAVAGLVVRSQLRRSMTGSSGLIGEKGVAYTAVTPEGGQVFVHGEYWQAVSEGTIAKEDAVEVVEVIGLKLRVRRIK